MKQFFINNLNKTKTFLLKNTKFFLFILIFALISFLYNKDNQDLNYFLKRGIVLEYSIDENLNINKDSIKKELINLGFKYTFIEDKNVSNSSNYDWDGEKIDKILLIAIPIKAFNGNQKLINSISDYIFDNYKNSKLTAIKTLNDSYNKPFNSLAKFFSIFLSSFLIWLTILLIFDKKKTFIKSSKITICAFFEKRKEDFKNLVKKTKEKGIGYFIKYLIFDDVKEDKKDMTKEIVSTIVFVLLCVIAIRYFIGELRWIPSGSMHPVILEHDRVFVEKPNLTQKKIKRGDILVFYPPQVTLSNSPFAILARLSGIFCNDIAFIKRVVGMPEDKFEIKYDEKTLQYRVYINDKALMEPYINSRQNWSQCNEKMYCGPFIIPKGHYFMMGDNRGNSQDSRFWGFLDENRIIGRANFMFYPFSRINLLKDKYLNLHKQKINGKVIEYNYIIDRYDFLFKI